MKYLLQEADAAERKLVEAWLEADERHRREWSELSRIWQESRQLADQSEVDTDAAWNRFRSRRDILTSGRRTKRTAFFSMRRVAAAVVVLVMALAAGWWWWEQEPAVEPISFESGIRPQVDTLPDGSVVSLNKQSKLEYPSRFAKQQRKVSLKGEAFFAVKPDPKKPFQIQAGDVTITVLGTSFNVREEEGEVEVVVETGRVKVSQQGKEVILQAGERIVVKNNNLEEDQKERQTDKLYQYYRTNSFVCDNTPLWRLAEVLEEAYDVKIEFARSSIRDLRWDVTIENESLDQVLDLVSKTFDIKIKREGQRVIFR